MRVGSSPTSIGLKSSTAPTTARVFHSSDASPQPNNPGSSVSTFTNTQLRIWAFTTIVRTSVIFMSPLFAALVTFPAADAHEDTKETKSTRRESREGSHEQG